MGLQRYLKDTELSADKVREIFEETSLKRREASSPRAVGEGISCNYVFSKERLELYRDEIEALLGCLPDKFVIGRGNGCSFDNMCSDRAGRVWGSWKDAEALMSLGSALGIVKFILPRPFWSAFLGGVPYVAICPTGFSSRMN